MKNYTEEFYKKQRDGSRLSAEEIAPLILELIQARSVVDVGCGVGTWLSVFKRHGVEDILGVDGDYVEKTMLEIPAEKFMPFDLRKPLYINRQFDLVISMEVAEHLPVECSEDFVDSLTRLGPVVLFSAAIPFQDGKNHINKQWPDFWSKLFEQKGYVLIDPIRKKIWQNDQIEVCYRQNTLLFVKEDCLSTNTLLKSEYEKTNREQIAIVHPEYYTWICLNRLPSRHFNDILFLTKDYFIRKVKKTLRIGF